MRRKVTDMHLDAGPEIEAMINAMMDSGGFMSKNLAEAATIFSSMVLDRECTKMLSFTADLVATGLRGVIADIVKNKMVDAVITTCGTLDHDIARNYSSYYHGSFEMDDSELKKRGYHRLGNIIIPEGSYGPLIEKKMQEILLKVYEEGKKKISTYELCYRIGETLGEDSILYWCNKNKIPVFVPGITDGAVGSQIWLFSQSKRDFTIDLLKDEDMLSDIIYSSKRRGGLVLGGGISKHHLIWWSQFKGGLDYACYITTAVEYDGSLSGAHVREAISWGKVKKNAKRVNVYCDATIALPLIYSYALWKLKEPLSDKRASKNPEGPRTLF